MMNFICKRYINKEKILRLNIYENKSYVHATSHQFVITICVLNRKEMKKIKQTNKQTTTGVISYSSNDSISIHTKTLPATNVVPFVPKLFSSVKLCASTSYTLHTRIIRKIEQQQNIMMHSK